MPFSRRPCRRFAPSGPRLKAGVRPMRVDATFRIATSVEYPRVEAAYEARGYHGGVSLEDVLYVAERRTELVTVVRRTQEHDLVLLRGMYVAPSLQRQRFGSRLLDVFVDDVQDAPCYCVLYSHLQDFYGRVGFPPLFGEAMRSFLRKRLASYRGRGAPRDRDATVGHVYCCQLLGLTNRLSQPSQLRYT